MNEFIDHLAELFEQFGPVSSRRMFGGYGIYHKGLTFAIVLDDVLYLKTDDTLAAKLKALGSQPFQFVRSGKLVTTSYYEAPPSLFDDRDEAAAWAQRAYDVALAVKR